MGREDYPLPCASWRLARAFCQSQGGDLPTEAQWEYAASAAGRPYKTLYPWGDDDPTCARAIVQREPPQPCFECGVGATSPTNGCVTMQGSTIVTWGPAPGTAADGADVGAAPLELEVSPANTRARALYERMGFRAKRNTTLRAPVVVEHDPAER